MSFDDGQRIYSTWFERIIETVEPFFDRFVGFVTEFYAQYQILGLVVAVAAIMLTIVALVYAFRLLIFLLGLTKTLFLKVTGIEKKRREKIEKIRIQKKERSTSYNELLKWGKKTEDRTSEIYWEEAVEKAAKEVMIFKAPDIAAKERVWQDMIAGKTPYDQMIEDMEKAVFSFEDKIHALIGRVTSMPKEELIKETGRLRVGIETLRNDTNNLKKLSEFFPDDTNIPPLIELCEAFIQSTKSIEKGFLAALAG